MKLHQKILIILTILGCIYKLSNAKEPIILLEEIFTIGENENAPVEYLFSYPKHITTDNKLNIYIADENNPKIRVFNKQGQFIKYIGRRGQGPGEMLEINCMTIDYNDNLIVVDRINHRITRFIGLGEEFKTYKIPIKHPIDPWLIFPFGKDKYIIYHRYRTDDKYYMPQPTEKILHIYNEDFSLIEKSLVDAEQIWDFNEPFLKSQVGKEGLNVWINEKNILLITDFYNGIIHIYKHNGNGYNHHKIVGKELKLKPFRILQFSDFPNYKFPPGTLVSSGPIGNFLVRMQYMSRGLFVLNNGQIIHFSKKLSSDNKSYIFYAEIFEKNGIFIGSSQVIENSSQKNKNIINSRVMWKDQNDQFYINAIKNDVAIIRVVQLQIN